MPLACARCWANGWSRLLSESRGRLCLTCGEYRAVELSDACSLAAYEEIAQRLQEEERAEALAKERDLEEKRNRLEYLRGRRATRHQRKLERVGIGFTNDAWVRRWLAQHWYKYVA